MLLRGSGDYQKHLGRPGRAPRGPICWLQQKAVEQQSGGGVSFHVITTANRGPRIGGIPARHQDKEGPISIGVTRTLRYLCVGRAQELGRLLSGLHREEPRDRFAPPIGKAGGPCHRA